LGEHEKVIADCTQALAIKPNFADAHGLRGSTWAAKRDYDKAIADYNEAVRLDPDPSHASFYKKAIDLCESKKNKQAFSQKQ
jgi:tetratricopeptide (TPR) repeat protein